ncbi:MAG TPA: pilus assembly protein TadG-related protein [Bradyrhizobium sp.]|jgi:Flp pilus assembly protein TadG|nr:pilus assembly protein TadG-related protein [Bradyrhizobium sp.]
MRALLDLIRRFGRDQRGNMTFTFAIVTVPLLTAVGAASDYSLATRMRAKLQSAADAAAVASISQQSPGFLAASKMTSDGTVTAGATDANKIFNGIMGTITGYTGLSETATVTKTGVNLASTVTFSAQVPTVFMKIAGFPTMTIAGNSTAGGKLPTYLDFYLMLDVSGSMGLPSTNAEQTRLAAINPDDFSTYSNGCTFACHFQSSGSCSDPSKSQKVNPPGVYSPINSAYPTNNYCLGYLISRVSQSGYQNLLQTNTNYPMKGVSLPSAMLSNVTSNVTSGSPNSLLTGNTKSTANSLTAVTSCPTAGTDACIQLRADAVGTALNATVATQGIDGLFATANNAEKVPNQFRIGLYPFIRYLYAYYGLTSSINGSPTDSSTINYAAANLATLLDTGTTPNITNLGSGGTHFENAFPSMSTIIKNVGDGSSSTNTKPFVFLVTDGAQDNQTCCGFSGSNSATVMPTGAASYCAPLKARGITIAVLYIPYEKIQNPTAVFNNEDGVANANIPNIPPSLQDCASSGFFFEADTPADITTALTKMFNQALSVAHITN